MRNSVLSTMALLMMLGASTATGQVRIDPMRDLERKALMGWSYRTGQQVHEATKPCTPGQPCKLKRTQPPRGGGCNPKYMQCPTSGGSSE